MKPTSVLTVNLPHFGWAVEASPGRGRCCHGYRAHEVLEGVEADGSWRTSRAKAYPPRMCRLISASFCQMFRQRWELLTDDLFPDIDPQFANFWAPLDPYYERQMGKDFADKFNKGGRTH